MSENLDQNESTAQSEAIRDNDNSGSGPETPVGGNKVTAAEQPGISGPQNPGGGN
jgi:hypothetical protein